MEVIKDTFPIPAGDLKLIKYVAPNTLGDEVLEEVALRVLIFSQEAKEYVSISSTELFARYEREMIDQDRRIVSVLNLMPRSLFLSRITIALYTLYIDGIIDIKLSSPGEGVIIYPTPILVAKIADTQKPPW